ncbi:MAG: hypothetical protein AB1422_00600 [bacterium]
MEVTELEIKVPKEILRDITIISKLNDSTPDRWTTTALTNLIHYEKDRLLSEVCNLYLKGIITKDGLQSLLGDEFVKEVEDLKTIAKRSVKGGIRYAEKLKKQIHKR